MTPNEQELYDALSTYAGMRSKVNTHCHQIPRQEQENFNLEALIRNSYINWCGVSWDASPAARENLLEKVRFNSFFVWLQKGLQELYGCDEPLSGETWPAWDKRIRRAYQDPFHARQVLTGRCAYQRMILDAYWSPGSNNDAPELFTPIFRVNAFFFGYSTLSSDHDGNNPYVLYPRSFIKDLDEYVAWVGEKIQARQASGCVALKIPIAYDRGLDFCEVHPDSARAAFSRLTAAQPKGPESPGPERFIPSNAPDPFSKKQVLGADPGDVKAFQDYLFFQICRIAAELDLPIQIHTGMGQGKRTEARYLQEAIQVNPANRFVLLHCSYPAIQDMAMLVDKYPNVNADLSFVPLISTSAGKWVLQELIERSTIGRIFWGCDTWTAEESFGSLLALQHTLAAALVEKIASGYFARQDAYQVIDDILFNNPNHFYKLDLTSS